MEKVKKFLGLFQDKKKLEEALSAINEALKAAEQEALDYMSENGIQNIKLDDALVFIATGISVKPKNSKEEIVKALDEIGLGDAAPRSCNMNTIRSLVSEMKSNNQTIPQPLLDTITIEDYFDLRVRKA